LECGDNQMNKTYKRYEFHLLNSDEKISVCSAAEMSALIAEILDKDKLHLYSHRVQVYECSQNGEIPTGNRSINSIIKKGGNF